MPEQKQNKPKSALDLVVEANPNVPLTEAFTPDELAWLREGGEPSDIGEWIETAPFDFICQW